ncbi:MAG: radical SAM protein, partial [Candidatus Omnitrophica bacterium]|nr:radical SAM protein [Candidatus Omnitrophota bacterium]
MRSADTEEKLKVLGSLSRFDTTGLTQFFQDNYLRYTSFIYPAVGFKSKCVYLFKVLQTNLCIHNCLYCANRLSRDTQRFEFSPRELAEAFFYFYRKRKVEGLFLSSGVYPEPDRAEEKMLATLRILRREGFSGFIHSVILPGVDKDLIKRIALLSDRISLNLETTTDKTLSLITPSKDFHKDLWLGLRKIFEIYKSYPLRGGLTTQLVVGASPDTDKQILFLSQRLYQEFSLHRVYYSGFIPVKDTPLENKPACSPLRELRLYQADFLLRNYGFKAEELIFNNEGNLFLDIDPKLAWARAHPENFPLEINRATKEQLLRVPGIGRTSVQRILSLRRRKKIWRWEELRSLGVRSQA